MHAFFIALGWALWLLWIPLFLRARADKISMNIPICVLCYSVLFQVIAWALQT